MSFYRESGRKQMLPRSTRWRWFVIPTLCALVILWQFGAAVTSSLAQKSDAVLEFTLHHPRPESRTQWRVPEAYLSPNYDWRSRVEPTTIIVMDVALPDMTPWWKSGLDMGRDDHEKRRITIELVSSYDFGEEKRNLPRLLKQDLELTGEYQNEFLRYRQVRKNNRGEVVPATNVGEFYLIPKEQIPGRTIFLCVLDDAWHMPIFLRPLQ